MLRRLVFRLILATALVGAVTISGAVVSGAAGSPHDVKVRDFQFGDGGPDGNITNIDPGDEILWHVEEGQHQIAPDDPSYFQGSDPLDAGADYGPIRFDTPGDYPYHCAIHPNMTGVIRVATPPTTTTTAPPTTTTTAPPTTTTTHPPTTTTTAHPTTTTTPPSTTPTTAAPGTPTTTPPTVGVAAPPSTTPTTAAPGPTTTTGKSKDKPAKTTDPAKTAGKNGKGDGNTTDEPPAAPGDQPPADAPAGDLPVLGTGEGGSPDFEAQEAPPQTNGDGQAAPAAEHTERNGMHLLLGTGAFVTLLGLGALGYKWRTRDSQYWTA